MYLLTYMTILFRFLLFSIGVIYTFSASSTEINSSTSVSPAVSTNYFSDKGGAPCLVVNGRFLVILKSAL